MVLAAAALPGHSHAEVFLRSVPQTSFEVVRGLSADGHVAVGGQTRAKTWVDGLDVTTISAGPNYIAQIAFSASDDGRFLSVQGRDATNTRSGIYDRLTGTMVRPASTGSTTTGYGISPNGHKIVGGMSTPTGRRPAIATADSSWQVVDPNSILADFVDMSADETVAVGKQADQSRRCPQYQGLRSHMRFPMTDFELSVRLADVQSCGTAISMSWILGFHNCPELWQHSAFQQMERS